MAAYRAGVKLKDERRGNEADYSRRRGIVHAEVMAPEGSAAWLMDREQLWNYVERIEKRKDAQLAREINMALPHELSDAQRLELVREFIAKEFVSRGMVADFALHQPVAEKGDDPRNFHAHILLTMRQAQENGLRAVKTREWNSDRMLLAWRAAWAESQNQALERAGHKVRVDHRSLAVRKAEAKERGDWAAQQVLDRVPEIHVGPKARKAGRAGPPKSRDRQVGPSRKGNGGEAQRRTLRYSAIDKGSRGEWNISRLAGNAQGAAEQLARIEKRLARARKRLRYYNRQFEFYAGQRTLAGKRKWKPWKKPVDVAGMFVSNDWERRKAHANKRKAQVAWLIDQLDQVFFSLLGIRESQLTRRTVWANRLKRWRPNELKPTRGGGRQRQRDLPG
jgi:ATP-dependent exoDNAse (exonuclease V) alpha subunit